MGAFNFWWFATAAGIWYVAHRYATAQFTERLHPDLTLAKWQGSPEAQLKEKARIRALGESGAFQLAGPLALPDAGVKYTVVKKVAL